MNYCTCSNLEVSGRKEFKITQREAGSIRENDLIPERVPGKDENDCASLIVFFEVLNDCFLARQSVYKSLLSVFYGQNGDSSEPSICFTKFTGLGKWKESHLLFSLKSDVRKVWAHLGHSSQELGLRWLRLLGAAFCPKLCPADGCPGGLAPQPAWAGQGQVGSSRPSDW